MASGQLLKILGRGTGISDGGGGEPDPGITDLNIGLPSTGETLLGVDYSAVDDNNTITLVNTSDDIVFQRML